MKNEERKVLNDVFYTRDFHLGAYLLCHNFKLLGSNMDNGNVEFMFEIAERINDVDTLINEYDTHTAIANIKTYERCIYRMRDELNKHTRKHI